MAHGGPTDPQWHAVAEFLTKSFRSSSVARDEQEIKEQVHGTADGTMKDPEYHWTMRTWDRGWVNPNGDEGLLRLEVKTKDMVKRRRTFGRPWRGGRPSWHDLELVGQTPIRV